LRASCGCPDRRIRIHLAANAGRFERLSVQLFAVPAGDGTWRIVLAQYLAQ